MWTRLTRGWAANKKDSNPRKVSTSPHPNPQRFETHITERYWKYRHANESSRDNNNTCVPESSMRKFVWSCKPRQSDTSTRKYPSFAGLKLLAVFSHVFLLPLYSDESSICRYMHIIAYLEWPWSPVLQVGRLHVFSFCSLAISLSSDKFPHTKETCWCKRCGKPRMPTWC